MKKNVSTEYLILLLNIEEARIKRRLSITLGQPCIVAQVL